MSPMNENIIATTMKWIFPAILVIFFTFYLTSFGIPEYVQGKEFSAGDDSEYSSIVEGPLVPTVDLWDVRKHPIFPFIAIPLYRIGLCLFLDSPLQKNLALIFPFAVIGLINLIVSYRIFLHVFGKKHFGIFPKLLTIFYGCCFSTWMFSSNVETYIITTLFQNLLLWYCVKSTHGKLSAVLLGFLFSLCVLASPAMLWMSIAILILFCHEYKDFKSFFLKSFIVFSSAFLMVLSVYVFYDLFYKFYTIKSHTVLANSAFGPKDMLLFSMQYLDKWLRWDLKYILTSFRAFFIESIVYTGLHTNIFLLAMFWVLITSFFMAAVLGLLKNRSKLPVIFKILVGFEGAYVVFFCFFSPGASILYVLPALLPFLTILFLGLSLSNKKSLKFIFAILLISVVTINNVNNYRHILKCDKFILKKHQYYQISNNPLLAQYY